MKKVLEIIRQGQIGGGESHLLDLVYYLDKTRYQPICLSFTGGEMINRLEKMGIKCYVIESQSAFDMNVQKRVKALMKDERVDIVHAHGSRAASNILYPAKSLHIPFIYTVHGWSFHDDQNPMVKTLRGWSEKLICYYADNVICVSESNAETGRQVFGLKEVTVIENGINLDVFDRNRSFEDRRGLFHFSDDDFVVGFIARTTKQKNPLLFLEALKQVHVKNSKVKGLFVGEGDMDAEVDAFIHNHQMADYLYRSPFRTDVPELLNSIDVYCLPSLWEGLSIALLEAMAMGKAIIATPTDGTKELIVDRENGLVVDFDNQQQLVNAILEFFDDKALFEKCSKNATLLVQQRFNAQRVADSVMEIYAKCAS